MLSADFESYCSNIILDESSMRTSAGEIAKKLNNAYYGLEKDNSSHLYIVGSVGRSTAVNGSSDLDLIFNLPTSVYTRFNNYKSNGQSALLQEVKSILQERYPRTDISGDGQVVVIEFDAYTVEVVPGFKQSDNRCKYPDTHDGGSWKYTDPLSEQGECKSCDDSSNGIYNDFCHMMRGWKNNVGFKFGGLLIDTLVYNHFVDNEYHSDKSTSDYLEILKRLFSHLRSQNKDQSYWYAVGSNQQVKNSDNGKFVGKAKEALESIEEAENDGTDINDALRELFGNDFPASNTTILEKASYSRSFRNTEEFIENMVAVDIQYDMEINCTVTQKGFRPFLLLGSHVWLNRDKQLDFFIESTNCPRPYNIYWKVRNVGAVAERKDCIRGQIIKTDSEKHHEHTDFSGSHYVECYLVKNNVCVARSKIKVPIRVNG